MKNKKHHVTLSPGLFPLLYSAMVKSAMTCLIPFYNENPRVLQVLKQLVPIKEIEQFICVDDGSTDHTAQAVRQQFPDTKRIKIVKLSSNGGKTAAIAFGVKHVKTSHVFLFDADLRDFPTHLVRSAVQQALENPTIDAFILRQLTDPLIPTLLRYDILVTGERILKTADLKALVQPTASAYQLELLINDYLETQQKQVCWVPFESQNHLKLKKWSAPTAMKKTFQFLRLLVSKQYLNQWLFFRPPSFLELKK